MTAAIKPRLWFNPLSGRWLCARLCLTPWDTTGYGHTPVEAYYNWMEVNLVSRHNRIAPA